MKRSTRNLLAGLACVLLGLVHQAPSGAQSGGDYALRKHVVAGGGGDSGGGSYLLRGSAGQHDAGPAPGGAMSGGSYTLRGGFWPDQVSELGEGIFADGFEGG